MAWGLVRAAAAFAAMAVFGASASAQVPLPVQSSTLGVELHPTPDFVVDRTPTEPVDAQFEPTQGVSLLLVDYQHDATLAEPAIYTRAVTQAVTFAGVTQISQVPILYDPSHQRFEVHHVRVTRDGVVEDREARTQLDILRREQLLELQMMTGTLTAVLRLDDIRVGDVLDIAYTVYGIPEVFEGRDSRLFQLGLGVAAEQVAVRSRWPREASWITRGPAPMVTETRDRNSLLLEVEPQPMDALELEAFVPVWEPMVPMLLVADFESWSEVAQWGEAYYTVTPDPAVSAVADSIMAEHDTLTAQILAALRFVQQDVRYFALVLGEGGYVPQPASQTLSSRAGDCKAKTLLFLSLLDALGVENAQAALVNTATGRLLPEVPATPTAFDHVIVRLELDGRVYWLDPTTAYQGGALDMLEQPDFGYALPLGRRGGDLEKMDPPRSEEPANLVRETYDITNGPSQPATVRIEIIYLGSSADFARAVYENYAPSELDDAVVAAYVEEFGEAELAGTTVVEDDIQANRFSIARELTLSEPFETSADGARRTLKLHASSITDAVPVVAEDDKPRVWPLGLYTATRSRHEITVLLPDRRDWNFTDNSEVIENEAFRFDWRMEQVDNALELVADLEPLVEQIAPELIASVDADQDRMRNLLKYDIWIAASARDALPELDLPEIELDLSTLEP